MTRLLCAFFLLSTIAVKAQYTTPGTGSTLSLSDLVELSGGVVTTSDGDFQINADLTIAPSDSLHIFEAVDVYIAPDVLITIQGAFEVEDGFFTVICCDEFYEGFRFEGESYGSLRNSTFELGGGIRVLTSNFEMLNCTVRYMNEGAASGAAVDLFTGKPLISNCTFLENRSAAIGSSANIPVAPIIEDCTLASNNMDNSNRPQINLGPSGSDTTIIRNNLVVGNNVLDQVGGIAFASLFGVESHAVITGNNVFANRYGIAVIGGNIHSVISNNLIMLNDTQGDPLLGGSGINIFASGDNSHLVLNNTIRENLWGVTLQGDAMANFGEIDNPDVGPGGNIFHNNGNGGEIFALFNNTPNTTWAQGNCWEEENENPTLESAEQVISHNADDPELGLVNFDPLDPCGLPTGLREEIAKDFMQMYPNPARAHVSINTEKPFSTIEIYDLSGRQIVQKKIGERTFFELPVSHLAAGMYVVRVNGGDWMAASRLTIE